MKAIIIGTGPGLTKEQMILAKKAQLENNAVLFGVNHAYRFGLDVFLACNWEYYREFWGELKNYSCDKWTWHKPTADKYGIKYVEGKWLPGLSTDKNYIHYHHGSGPQIVNIALHYGAKEMYLIGWDMRYPGKVDNRTYTAKRHYFGEYPKALQHWPQTGPNGEFTGLIEEMETIKPEDYDIQIYNCTKGSALKCYPFLSTSEFQNALML